MKIINNNNHMIRTKDVGKYKAECAVKNIKKLNPGYEISFYKEKLGFDKKYLFDDHFWNEIDVVFSAVDSYEARKIIDEFCITYEKKFFDCGTSGLNFNTEVIIPHKTISYSRRPPIKNTFAGCTLKYPTKIEHSIKWALDLFHKIFCEIPTEFKKILENSNDSMAIFNNLFESQNYQQAINFFKVLISFFRFIFWGNIYF